MILEFRRDVAVRVGVVKAAARAEFAIDNSERNVVSSARKAPNSYAAYSA